MKNAGSILKKLVLVLMVAFCIAGVRPVIAKAATKTVKNLKYTSELTSAVKKKAAAVKKGTTKLKVKKSGFLKFKVPKTKTYTFTISGQKASDGDYNNGYAYIMRPTSRSYTSKLYLDSLTVKTQGGETTSIYFNSERNSYSEVTTGSFIPKRICKVKLNKGETIYFYISFLKKGSFNLKIK